MNLWIAWLCLLGMSLPQSPTLTGIKWTVQHTQAGNPGEPTTYYIAGDRKRIESRGSVGSQKPDGSLQMSYGPRLVMITRCDLGKIFDLNLDSSEYTSAPYPPKRFSKEELQARRSQTSAAANSSRPTLRIEEHSEDTGERKEMFGLTARHVVTTRKQIPLEGSLSEPQETVTDGWYVDLDPRLSCDYMPPKGSHGYSLAVNGKQPREKVEFVSSGEAEKGFPLQSVLRTRATHTEPDGSKRQLESTFEYRVTEFEDGPLDPALFEVPAGFAHVEHIERNPVVDPLQ